MNDVKIHESCYVDENVTIGEGTRIWHFSHLQNGCRIGKNCSLGKNVSVGNNVIIGNSCKIQNNVSLYEGCEFEDYVFCGTLVAFTNVSVPRCKYPQRGKQFYKKTLVKEGASIGSGSTIICGNTIGKGAFVAAGAVVTKDVDDYSLVAGVPARHVSYICECGQRLDETLECKKCSLKYKKTAGKVSLK